MTDLRARIVSQVKLLRVILLILVPAAAHGLEGEQSTTTSSTTTCRFGGAEYHVGHTWHPRLESKGTVFCVTCQCYQGGRMNCSSRECPVNCSRDLTSECCNICTEMQTSRPSTPDVVACIHNGLIYKDGQTVPANSTGMKTTSPNQCVQCKCQEGMVLCEVHTCPPSTCREQMLNSDSCCPQCPGSPDSSDAPSVLKFTDPTAPRDRRDKDCISAGKYFLDGSSWHPVIGPFGPMDCVMCQCTGGTIQCNRFKCPSRRELPCLKPVKQFGQCCPVCPVPVLPVMQQSGIPEVGSLQCVPKSTQLVVYRAQGAGNLSEFLQYAFQKPGPVTGEMDVHSWVLKRGAVETFQAQTITGEDFNQLRHKFKFYTLGTTTNKHMSKFVRREKKLRRRCIANCSSKIQRLEESLNLEKASMRMQCLSSELLLPPA